MNQIYTEKDLKRETPWSANSIDSSKWTCIIPAAGRGSRLDYSRPKILYPVLGKTILEHLIELFRVYCDHFVIVASPDGYGEISAEIERLGFSNHFEIVVQKEPLGMADAVYCGKDAIRTPYTAIVWGDQICLRDETISHTLACHQEKSENVLSFPTVLKRDPYIHFHRDEGGRILKVFQKREGEIDFEEGENDCGFFTFSTVRLFSILKEQMNSKSAFGAKTKEVNLLQLFPAFDDENGQVTTLQIANEEETLGINTVEEARAAESILRLRKAQETKKIKVVLFSGGRGTASLADAFGSHPQIDLYILLNAYDDGLSTGRLRRFIPGLLGPSDVRKNLARLVPNDSDAGRALRELLEYRFPDPFSSEDAVRLLSNLYGRGLEERSTEFVNERFWNNLESVSYSQAHFFEAQVKRFLDYFSANDENFDFSDCSFGNIVFAGAFLNSGSDFNRTIQSLEEVLRTKGKVLNVTQGEPYVLVGLKSDGSYLRDEAEIVSPQNVEAIEEIYLLEDYLGEVEEKELRGLKTSDEKMKFLQSRSLLPKISHEAREVLETADLIIYGPGTQHSSLFPSYLTEGVAEAIVNNKTAEKIFVANTRKDHEIQSETINSLSKKLIYYLNRKSKSTFEPKDLVSRYFFQDPSGSSPKEDYLDFKPEDFELPAKQLLVLDWESEKGKHSGDRVLDELISIVNERAKIKLHSFSYLVSIVVPVYDEEKTLDRVLSKLNLLNLQPYGLAKEIIVVDGGSTDRSRDIAMKKSFVRFYDLPKGSFGRGAALRYGAEQAKGNVVAFFPSDDEYEPSDLINLVLAIRANEYEAIFGSRSIKCLDMDRRIWNIYRGKRIPYLISKYGGMLLSVLCLLLFNRFVTDPLTSVKVFDRRLLKRLALKANGVELESEIIARLSKSQKYILEMPVEFRPRLKTEGKKITISDGIYALFYLFKMRLSTKR